MKEPEIDVERRGVRGWLQRRLARPVNLTELFRSTAMLLFAFSAVVAVLVVYSSKVDEKGRADKLADALATQQGIDNCRAQVASAVTDATTTYLFASGRNLESISNLVGALAVRGDIQGALSNLAIAAARASEAAVILDAARDARVRFEQHPVGGCKDGLPQVEIGRSSPSPGATTTTVAGVPPVSVKLRRSLPKSDDTTSTTAPETSTSGTPAPTTTTTAPNPLCDLIPDPSIPSVTVPCL